MRAIWGIRGAHKDLRVHGHGPGDPSTGRCSC